MEEYLTAQNIAIALAVYAAGSEIIGLLNIPQNSWVQVVWSAIGRLLKFKAKG